MEMVKYVLDFLTKMTKPTTYPMAGTMQDQDFYGIFGKKL